MVSDLEDFLKIAEIFTSLQGEGMHAGLPCHFIRLAGCDLQCRWCDTPEAGRGTRGKWISLPDILETLPKNIPLVQLTGGEPLLQQENLLKLIERITQPPFKKKVLLETGGHRLIDGIPKDVHIVMDIKLPGSGEAEHDFSANFPFLKKTDELKFVVADRNDFDAAAEWIRNYQLDRLCNLLCLPVAGELELKTLARWVLESGLPVRVQPQLHKVIWGMDAKGV